MTGHELFNNLTKPKTLTINYAKDMHVLSGLVGLGFAVFFFCAEKFDWLCKAFRLFHRPSYMGSIKKRRKAKINKHKRRKKLRLNRHKKRTWQK